MEKREDEGELEEDVEERQRAGEVKGMARSSESELDLAHNDVSPTVSQGQRQRRAVSV